MPDLNPVFTALRAVLVPYAARLDAARDNATELYVNTRHLQHNKQVLFFAAVQLKKAYVSYHLMPVYLQPTLLAGMSAQLKARMHGKSCFNFSAVDAALFQELAALTQVGFESYREQGFV